MKIAGSAAVVTGAGSGLGAATARCLAQHGAKVGVLDLDMDAANAVAEECGGIAARCDVADPESAAAALAVTCDRHGLPRILVNCAGVSIGRVSLVEGDRASRLGRFERLLRVNLNGTLTMISLVAEQMVQLPVLEQGERGHIVLTASLAAYEGQSEMSAYAASKGGIVALTLPCARELAAYGIRVNTIAPGYFETPLIAGLPDYVRAGCAGSFVFPKRFGTPDEYAELVVHLSENQMLNGETIRLDGAMRLPPSFLDAVAERSPSQGGTRRPEGAVN